LFQASPTSFLGLHRWIARPFSVRACSEIRTQIARIKTETHARAGPTVVSVPRYLFRRERNARDTVDRPLSCCCAGIEIINTQIILGSRVVSVLDSVAEGPGFKLQPGNSLRQTVTPIVPLFTNQRNWYSSPLKSCGDNCRPGEK